MNLFDSKKLKGELITPQIVFHCWWLAGARAVAFRRIGLFRKYIGALVALVLLPMANGRV